MDTSPFRFITRFFTTVNQREAMLIDIAPWARANAARAVTIFGTLTPMVAVDTRDVRLDTECICVDGWHRTATNEQGVVVKAGPYAKRVVSFSVDGHHMIALQAATYRVGNLYVAIAQCFEDRENQGPLAGVYCLAIAPDDRVFIIQRRLERVRFADSVVPWPPEPE